MIDLYEELKKILFCFEKKQIDYALAGGLAFSLYARPRATMDIDLVIKSDDWGKVLSVMRSLGYLESALPMTFLGGRVKMRRLTRVEKGKTDLMVADFLLAQSGVVKKILSERVTREWEGGKIWLVSRKGLVQLKKLRSSKQDKLDIEELKGEKAKKEK